ncbi:PatU3 [Raphidiopsis brookii D9]|nr:PatU3 [Raphidiopsis brookii D9]
MQERFQVVLKRRLQIEIQNRPPLFPWESQLAEYPEVVEDPGIALIPTWGWLAQQSQLSLPIPLPDKVFQHLVDRCQSLVTSCVPLGPKLMQAVADIFPDEDQLISDLAGLVLRSSYRSVSTLETLPSIDKDYSKLQPRQQVALSLIAAKQLLESLTLSISLSNPVLEQQWQSYGGTLTIQAQLLSLGATMKLCVYGQLPTPGTFTIQGNGTSVTVFSKEGHKASLELNCPRANQTYVLAVEFPQVETQPLLLAINVTV